MAGADLTVIDPDGFVALHRAARRGEPCVLQSLLEHGALVNVRDTQQLRTPLMAAMNGIVDACKMIEMLVAANADVNAVDQNNETALMIALVHVSLEYETFTVPASICIALIEAGQTYRLHQVHCLKPSIAGRRRRHD